MRRSTVARLLCCALLLAAATLLGADAAIGRSVTLLVACRRDAAGGGR
jgi:hypothetical protein